jgi:hypothetical protein
LLFPAQVRSQETWFDVPLAGGTRTLAAFGIARADRAEALPLLARILYGQESRADAAAARLAEVMLGQFEPALETVTALLERQAHDTDPLFVALQVLYRRHSDTPLGEAEKKRFADYAAYYANSGGSRAALVAAWLKQVSR